MFERLSNLIESTGLSKYIRKDYLDHAMAGAALLLAVSLNWDARSSVAFAIAVWLLFNPIKSVVLARGSILLLVLVPFLIVLRREQRAEQAASLSYLLLILAVCMAIYEYFRAKKDSAR